MSINKQYFISFVNNSNDKIQNERINKIIQISKYDFFFLLSNKTILHVSLNPQNPFIKITDSIPFMLKNEASSFLSSCKRELSNARILDISIANDDKIIKISFKKTYDNYEINNGTIVLEFMTNHPNIIILNSEKKIILAYKYSNLFISRVIQKSLDYTFPEKGAKTQLNIDNGEEKISEYLSKMSNQIKLDEFPDVYKLVNNKSKQLLKKINNLNTSLLQNADYDKFREYGDYIYEHLDELKSNKLVIDDVEIELDQRLSIVNNANKFYKKYKKLKQGYSMNEDFLQQAIVLHDYFVNLESQIKNCSLEELEDIREELSESGYLKSKKRLVSKKLNPYQITNGNDVILFGKNNYQNDNLTFKVAKKDYYFFHIQNYSGAHVVISSSDPDQSLIQLAAEICLYLSNKESGDVLLADVKDVKKAENIGQVKINKFETIHIKSYDINNILALVKSAGRKWWLVFKRFLKT